VILSFFQYCKAVLRYQGFKKIRLNNDASWEVVDADEQKIPAVLLETSTIFSHILFIHLKASTGHLYFVVLRETVPKLTWRKINYVFTVSKSNLLETKG